MKLKFLVPLIIFVALAGFLYVGLGINPRDVPSPLVGKPAPVFTLPQLKEGQPDFVAQDMRGKVWILNVWATWCSSCRQEHPVLNMLAKQNIVPVVGLNFKEVRGDSSLDDAKVESLTPEEELTISRERANKWLVQRENPYSYTVLDLDGRVAVDYGVYGVPESYVIDKQGVIRMKYTGPITPDALRNEILPLVRKLNG
jgi:cytochrome c biogenesis protein CcmG/thiol:disulfide interchange protein DsbE